MVDPGASMVLHTSKRMHFIEDPAVTWPSYGVASLHTSKRMHFIEETRKCPQPACKVILHTSKRMHFIEETSTCGSMSAAGTCIRQNVCTSLRKDSEYSLRFLRTLAYVKTYALH